MEFLWIGAASFLIFLLQEAVYRKTWGKGLQVQVTFAGAAIREGEECRLKEVVQNRKWMPLPVLHVNLQLHRALVFANQENTAVSDQAYRRDIFSMLPFQQITRTLFFTGTKRGYYTCREVELVGRTLFFQGPFVKKQPQSASLYVYPKRISPAFAKTSCRELLGEYLWKKKLFEDPFSFQGIRDYLPFDSFRQVNWKAYGRTNQLKVNVYEHRAMANVRLFLNLEGDSIWTDELLLETVIRAGGGLAEQWIRMGIPTGLITNGRDGEGYRVEEVKPGVGKEHGETILKALSRIDLGKGTEENFLEKRQAQFLPDGMAVYISCSSRKEDLACLERLRQRGKTILWLHVVPAEGKENYPESEHSRREEDIYHGRILEWRAEE